MDKEALVNELNVIYNLLVEFKAKIDADVPDKVGLLKVGCVVPSHKLTVLVAEQVLAKSDGLVQTMVGRRVGIHLGTEIIGLKGIYVAHNEGRIDDGKRPLRIGAINEHGGPGGI